MPVVNHVSEVERIEAQLEAAMSASPRDNTACVSALEDAVALTRTDPDADAAFYLPELLDQLAEAYGDAGRFDDALRAMREAVDAGLGGQPDGAGMTSIRIAPIRIDALLAWCAERGEDPGDARPGYAAHLARTHPRQLISWPPGRNEPCWCGSARKYKKCCSTPVTGDHD